MTKDGSEIRELAGVPTGNSENQSLAEATVPPGGETEEHHHRVSEEIYLFTHGSGRLRLGDEESEVTVGDTVVIPPGTRHKLWNTGQEPLKLLCCCSPPYSHEDTYLIWSSQVSPKRATLVRRSSPPAWFSVLLLSRGLPQRTREQDPDGHLCLRGSRWHGGRADRPMRVELSNARCASTRSCSGGARRWPRRTSPAPT